MATTASFCGLIVCCTQYAIAIGSSDHIPQAVQHIKAPPGAGAPRRPLAHCALFLQLATPLASSYNISIGPDIPPTSWDRSRSQQRFHNASRHNPGPGHIQCISHLMARSTKVPRARMHCCRAYPKSHLPAPAPAPGSPSGPLILFPH
ncbi:hypothetical protein B0H14DRAFT_3059088, partial [Mycena olivaceomarginata]